MENLHVPVMLEEALEYLDVKKGGIYVDGTLGGCGHAGAIADAAGASGTLIGIDRDPLAVENAFQVFSGKPAATAFFHDNFSNLFTILEKQGISGVGGILLDLGTSLNQIHKSGRGFSFSHDEFLDMRMDLRSQDTKTAFTLVNELDEKRLQAIFKEYGEEKKARQIARCIVQERGKTPLRTTNELAQIVTRITGPPRPGSIHPATRIFMALRIAVNQELDHIQRFFDELENNLKLLAKDARVVIISFHSLEDRIVKHRIRKLEKPCTCPPEMPVCVCGKEKIARNLTPKPIRPKKAEIEANPPSRSAKLRAFEKNQ